MNLRCVPILAGWALLIGPWNVFAETSQGPATINFGPLATSNWRSDDFKGTTFREWNPSGDSFCLVWDTEAGDQIGRIGMSYGSSLLGAKISDIKPDCVMSTDAVYTTTDNRWFYWSIYGWTHEKYTSWGDTPKGWNNEFYIIFYTEKPRSEFLKDPGCRDIGNVTVDGNTFDCYMTPGTDQKRAQWLAVCRTKTWSASIHLKGIFDFWRSKGMADEYVTDLGWALEGFASSKGKLQLTKIKIPALIPPAASSR